MGFQQFMEGRWNGRYERLGSNDERAGRSKRRWVKKLNGRLRGIRLSRSRRLNWKAFSFVLLPKRIARFYADIMKRVNMEDVYPAITFSYHWGLPVLSHSNNLRCRNSGIVFDRTLSCIK
ncbi:hypothetical protein LIER_20175 [Lithospermum erythrorhizon]|uniref:Uncharacterized protein n=1 Tax=Lithospermum erythrorhizon TaxID=34254 RepID=A0AAV3QR73_LITER